MDVWMTKKPCQLMELQEKLVCHNVNKTLIVQLIIQALEQQNHNAKFNPKLVDHNIVYQLLLIMVQIQEHVQQVQKLNIPGGFKFVCMTQMKKLPIKFFDDLKEQFSNKIIQGIIQTGCFLYEDH